MTFRGLGAVRRSPQGMLLLMTSAVPFAHITWRVLLNNFAIEEVGLDGAAIGLLQSIRELPGLFAVSILLLHYVICEQRLASASLFVLGLGVAVTGFFPTTAGLWATTLLMSIGFHYYEATEQSLVLQLTPQERLHGVLGRMVMVGSSMATVAFALLWLLLQYAHIPYHRVYVYGGLATMTIALVVHWGFPLFPSHTVQHRRCVLRRRYLRYYLLTLLGGARRQIFVVFAGILMVERFQYSAANIALLFLIHHTISFALAPTVASWIRRVGERHAMVLEYTGLIGIFMGYGLTTHATVAAGLYLADGVFFALSMALKGYFKQIADPADIAGSSGVGMTINHIAAVGIPVGLGALWHDHQSLVFFCGAGLAALSLWSALTIAPRVQDRCRVAAT